MNNNDILNGLYRDGESYQPSDRLDPLAIENSLNDVNRKSNKKIISACVTLGLVCITVTSFLFVGNARKPVTPVNPNSYEEIYKVVNSIKKKNESTIFDYISDINVSKDSVMENTADGNTSSGNPSANNDLEMNKDYATGSSNEDYSDTNVQVEGVDEADIVKTDGNYIYSVKENKIYISDPNNGKPEVVSEINVGCDISEIYIHNNKLVAICRIYDLSNKGESTPDTLNSYNYAEHYGASVVTYDLTDITSPKHISSLSQEGYYISSRKIDNVIYLTTNHDIYYYDDINKSKPETYCPVYSVDGKVSCIAPESISICEYADSISYTTVASINLDKPDSFADICSVLGGGYEIYASHNNIYITSYNYNEIRNVNTTEILRFSIDGTEIEEDGRATVNGEILNQFSMDEYNGYFRIVTNATRFSLRDWVTSTESTTTALYVLDENLKLVGKTEDVAKGESVKSVRFDGDIAYFVTFRQTDPLFAVDLSNPENPTILSELKIPGFSEYMHVMSDDLLLGFGRDADPETGIERGLKLSMFDISDNTEVKEITTKIFTDSDSYAYSEAEYNHKAIYVDEKKFIIGIPYISYKLYNYHYIDDTNYTTENEDRFMYAIFKYDREKNEFVIIKKVRLIPDSPADYYYDAYSRGLRIGDYFYIVTTDSITSYNYSDFEKISELKFE